MSQSGRLIQIKNGSKQQNGTPDLEVAEFGFSTDVGQEELWIGSKTGKIKLLTERDSSALPNATNSTNGLMSSSDKSKLDGIASGANNYTHPSSHPASMITGLHAVATSGDYNSLTNKPVGLPASGGNADTLGGKSASEFATATHTHTIANVTGLQSALDGKASTSDLTSHINNTTLHVTSTEKNTWNAKADTSVATASANGLMSASDKTKLNSIATGATSTVVVDNLTSTSSTNALSANQGRLLNEKIATISSGSGGGSLANIYQYNVTSNPSGTAFGWTTNASGVDSYAQGRSTDASGQTSHAEGYLSNASGYTSHAEGASTVASGSVSHAEGRGTYATGDYTHSQGYMTRAINYCSTSMGVNSNMSLVNATTYSSSADALVLGNGTGTTPSNAFRVKFDGSVYGLSAFNSTGADYAEYFEWIDGNVDNEDRVGYFVTLDKDKMRKANSSDTYILGIISANPSVIGDASSELWCDAYQRDEFGRVKYHYVDVEHEELDENGEKVTVIKNEYQPIYNPDYDNSLTYVPREDRKEWDTVGMMGKLLVRDDGTCEVNGYCKPNDDGIATKSDEGYRVMKRVSDNIIQVLVK